MFTFSKKKISQQTKSIIVKKQQKNLQNLTQDVKKSRIAVEHIARIKKDSPHQNLHIEQIKNQLSQSIMQIHYQEKRQALLRELICVLKGQMNKIQIKDKEIKQKQIQELDKKIKHIREDIDKIFLKKNHQVAKIAVLKQTASQNRSQRVVFSNLFKKLEKQLKQGQQLYKNQLLRAEKNKADLQNPFQKRKSLYGKQQKLTNLVNHSYFIEEDQIRTVKIKTEGMTQNPSFKLSDYQLFNIQTSHSKTFQPDPLLQTQTISPTHTYTHRHTKSRLGRLNLSNTNFQGYQIAMQQLQKFCSRIKSQTDCTTVSQIKQQIDNIQPQNNSLQQQILQINNRIQLAQSQKKKIQSRAYQQQIQNDQFQQFQQYCKFGNKLGERSNKNSEYKIKISKDKPIQKQAIKYCTQDNSLLHRQNTQNFKHGHSKSKQYTNQQIYGQFQQILNIFGINLQNKQEQIDSYNSCNNSDDNQQNICNINNTYLQSKLQLVDTNISKLILASRNKQISCTVLSQNKSNNVQRQLKFIDTNIEYQPNNTSNNIYLTTKGKPTSSNININTNKTKISYVLETEVENDKQYAFDRRQSNCQVNNILQRMDKFGSCQKFLDKDGFYGEYRKQISKKIRIHLKKA